METLKTLKVNRSKPNEVKSCKECGLYLNQLPVYDPAKQASVFWVGLSAVKIENDLHRIPLAQNTRSGKLISTIEQGFQNQLQFYKTNLVKCLPLNKEVDKIRYPRKKEMSKCYPNMEYEIQLLQPSIIFLLGKQVANFVFTELELGEVDLDSDYSYKLQNFDGVTYVPIHHPSYMLVYKRKDLEAYQKNISSIISALT